jgi:virulence-associated protein VapD
MAEEQDLTVGEPQPTAEAIKQRRKREKAAAKDAALGVEKFTVEVAGVFKPDLKRVMAAHGFNNQQEVYQNLLRNLIAADFETQVRMLKCVTTPFVVTEKVSRIIQAAGMKSIADDPPEPEDEIETPA